MNRTINAELMKTQTWGCEVETSGLSMLDLINVIADYFNTSASVESCRYDHDGSTLRGYQCLDNQGRIWNVVGDASLSAHNGGCGEVVTPVMKYDDIPTFQEIIRKLREKGAVSNDGYGCGVHIHVGHDIGTPNGHTPKSMRNLANMMASHENILIKAVNVSHRRYNGGYCNVSNSNFIRELNRIKPRTMDQLKSVWYTSQGYNVPRTAQGNHYHSSRYRMLNYHCAFFGHTIEFRLFEFHGSKMHAGELKAYIQLCLAMSSYAKLVAYIDPKQRPCDNEKFAMNSWLKNMGLMGNEFKTCRKMLTKRLRGDCAYRNGRPVTDNGLDDLHLVTE